ncbi:MAG: hypothetical protein M3297_12720 [Thermoproteota archaeon]|nr:hypothetical protein [Thermoproteota archaeon]
MKSRRLSSNVFNRREVRTSDHGKNIKSKPTAKRSKAKSRNLNSGSRAFSVERNVKPKTRKRAANKQSKGITIRRSSGRREKFSTERMAQTVSRSGVPFIMARDISKKIAKKATNKSLTTTRSGPHKNSTEKKRKMPRRERVITAGEVRQLVAEELIGRNRPDIAKSYSGNPPENTTKHIYDSPVGKQPNIDNSSVNTQHSRKNEVIHDQSKRGGGIMT